jgi:hypothetical protein
MFMETFCLLEIYIMQKILPGDTKPLSFTVVKMQLN